MEADAAEAAELSEVSTNTNEEVSLADEPLQENEQKVPEIRLQEDEVADGCDQEDQKDENMRTRDHLKTSQRDRRSVSPLSFFKEDFSQLKEEVLKVFRDSENKPATSTLDLLKDDFSQFREDVTSVFKSSDPKPVQSAEKTMNRLSFLDLSNVFRINKGAAAREESSFRIKAEEPFLQSLFRKTSQKVEKSQEVTKTFSETNEEHVDAGLRGNFSEQNGETADAEKINVNETNKEEDSEVDVTVSCLSETQQTEETVPTSHAAEQRCEGEETSEDVPVVSVEDERIKDEEQQEQEEKVVEEKEQEEQVEEQEKAGVEEEKEEKEKEEEPSETLPWESLSSGISLFTLRDPNKEDTRDEPGEDMWSVKNFACYLTFDPNTANSELQLRDCNRKATRVWSNLRPSDHPDQFKHCPQVLCREGLLDKVYWEVVWSGGADIGVTYNNISRDGDAASCLLGHNERSWSLECSEGSYTPCHRNRRFRSSSPQPFTHRVGVYLNWSAGSLSFYCVSQDAMVHLHTFTSSFTEPLYPGFWVWAYEGSVSLCQVELDWERLLQ